MLFSSCLIFWKFQPDDAYKSVADIILFLILNTFFMNLDTNADLPKETLSTDLMMDDIADLAEFTEL